MPPEPLYILLIDISGDILPLLGNSPPPDMEITTVRDRGEALQQLESMARFDVVCIESPMPDGTDVVALVRTVKEKHPTTGVLVLGKEQSMSLGMSCIGAGAYDYQGIAGVGAGIICGQIRRAAASTPRRP